jgi:D-alanine-D-alanine ligase
MIPAELSPELTRKVQDLAVRSFRAVDGSGLGRVDFFVQEDTGTVYVNEINTMPGFTRISMYPKLWEASGIGYSELINRLLELAVERFEDRRKNKVK